MKFIILFLLASTFASGATFTSKASGNWSSGGQTTWNETGVPGDGDTVSIGAHTVTVDTNTTIGTSPNDATTKVVDKTSSTGALVIGSGVTFTVKGNIGGVNNSVFTMNSGSTLTFDASASGGTPIYKFINAGFQAWNFNGTNGSRCTVQAVSGRTASLSAPTVSLTATYTDFTRLSTLFATNGIGGNVTVDNCAFNTCDRLNLQSTGTTNSITVSNNTFTAGSHATDDLQINYTGTHTSGTRLVTGNVFTKAMTANTVIGFTCTYNYFGGGLSGFTGKPWRTFRSNFLFGDRANGQVMPSDMSRCYLFSNESNGNWHPLAPQATVADTLISQNVFESAEPDLIDTGDAMLINSGSCSGGFRIRAKNNLVLYNETGAVASGTTVTFFNLDSAGLFEAERNTSNIDDSSVPSSGSRGSYAVAEAGGGTAGQLPVLKSNLVWSNTSGEGWLAERVSADVKDIITAAGANYNWTWNTAAGDNQRSYSDRAAANTLWTAGDAVAASVDVNQGSGNPQFYDDSRNLAAWATARGYGAGDNAAGLAAIQANPTARIPDLVAYVFEGFRPTNASLRNAAHDGGCVGAANFYKARNMTKHNEHIITLARFGL